MRTLGVIGLGTMGTNLARNAAQKGFAVSIFNRTPEKVESFLDSYQKEGKFSGFHSLSKFIDSLPQPRIIVLMVSAGEAVDALIESLLPLLSKNDVLLDGGNSHFRDTDRRLAYVSKKGIAYIGLGVSGGEEGALKGPSMMPGGTAEALKRVMPLLEAMAANDGEGGKCVTMIGPGGSGHFVKMVHNGIEYAVMQLIAEAYALLKDAGVSSAKIAQFFADSLKGDLRSYLMEVTAKVLRKRDEDTDHYLVDMIRDVAGQKGTGKWTIEAATELAVAVPTIAAAVDARFLTAFPENRKINAAFMPVTTVRSPLTRTSLLSSLSTALEVATLAAYIQGYNLLSAASDAYGWSLSLPEITRIWKGGCIIRSTILDLFLSASRGSLSDQKKGKLAMLKRVSGKRQVAWRSVVLHGIARGVPIPAFASTVAHFDTVRSEHLPQNLIQAQRDFFGAHGFERIDREGVFHVHW